MLDMHYDRRLFAEKNEMDHSISDDGVIHLRCPRLEALLHKKTSKEQAPGHTGGACPGFTFASIEGSPSVECPYGIERRTSKNAYYNKIQWFKCFDCARLNTKHSGGSTKVQRTIQYTLNF